MTRRGLAWVTVAATAMAALVLAAIVDGPPRTNEDRVRALSEDFACPTCDGQSVAESNAVVAEEIRREIRRQVDAGATDEEITDVLIAGFDESIDLRPRASGLVGLVWVLPVFATVFGVAGLVMVFRRWAHSGGRQATSADESIVAELRAQRRASP